MVKYTQRYKLSRLIKGLRDEYATSRADAARGIAQMGPSAKGAVPSLCKTLGDKEDVNVRTGSAWALMKIGPAALPAVPYLVQALQDEEWSVRLHSAQALGKIHTWAKPVLKALTKLLDDEHPLVREATAEALAQIGPRAIWAKRKLVNRLNRETDHRPWSAMMTALTEITKPRRRRRPALMY